MKITVVGTGYVGLVTGTCLSEVGNDVICFDTGASKIAMLERGEIPIFEPGLQDMVAGGVEVAPVSLPEARSLIDAGKVKSLAIMNDKPSTLYPNVPTLKSSTGSDWRIAGWRGIGGPKGLPADVQIRLGNALKKIHESKEFQGFMANRGFNLLYADAKGFEQLMTKGDANLGTVMKAVGLAR